MLSGGAPARSAPPFDSQAISPPRENHPPEGDEMNQSERGPALLRPAAAQEYDAAALELAVGDEIVEVRVDPEGVHFRHTGGTRTEGHLSWEEMIALSLLPRARSAA
jgi:hypothetical protein